MSRNTHDIDATHPRRLNALVVVLSDDVGAITAGTDLESALDALHDRILVLEDEGVHKKRFTIDAQIVT